MKCTICNKTANKKRIHVKKPLTCSKTCYEKLYWQKNKEYLTSYTLLVKRRMQYAINAEHINMRSRMRYAQQKIENNPKQCINCHKSFIPKSKLAKSCSKYCADVVSRNKKRSRHNEWHRMYYATNVNRRLSSCLRSRINKALKGNVKSLSTKKMLGCSIPELKKYLEAQFQPKMTWNNYGPKGWHIDHIRPLSSFDLSKPKELKKACHYSNLQPLWAKDNLIKGGKYDKIK